MMAISADFHEPDDARLVHRIGQLAGKRGEEKEGEDEEAAGDRVEGRLLGSSL
jgi:hypothetical protein